MYILYRCCRGVGGTTTLRLRKTKSRTSRKKTTGIAQDRVSYVQRKPLKRMPSLQLIVICLSFAWIRISLKKIKSLCVQESKKRPVVSEFLSVCSNNVSSEVHPGLRLSDFGRVFRMEGCSFLAGNRYHGLRRVDRGENLITGQTRISFETGGCDRLFFWITNFSSSVLVCCSGLTS